MKYIKSVERIFWPVGQGAFYSEKLKFDDGKEFNIVYDCGSNNKKALEKSIDNFNSKTIDILFISHFHNDHISGIEKLLQKSEIKMIIIPYLLKEEVIIEVSNDLVHSNYESIKFLNYCYYNQLKNYEYLQNYTFNEKTIEKLNNIKIIKKYPDNDEENLKEYFFEEGIDFYELIEKNEVYAKKPLKINISQSSNRSSKNTILWVYSLYNHKSKEYYSKISSKLKEKDIDILKPENYKENIDKIIDVYKEFFKNLNDSSMFLYSGFEEICKYSNYYSLRYFKYFDNCCCYCRDTNVFGCLYTGDANLKKVKIDIIYKIYLDKIITFQIPHHGSIHSFDKEVIDKLKYTKNWVVSYGIKNRYRHPHKKLLEIFLRKGIRIIPVNNNSVYFAEYNNLYKEIIKKRYHDE